MIDYIRLKIPKNLLSLIIDKLSDILEVKLSPDSNGETVMETYMLENFTVNVYRPHIIISGSIHTFHNRINGRPDDNRDDFSHEEFCVAVKNLEALLGIELRFYPLIQLEIGVNLKVDFHVKDFLRQNVLTWDFERAIVDWDKGNKGHLKEYKTSQLYIKVYDKGRQLTLGYEELRLELKFARVAYFRSLGLSFLNDLMDRDKFDILARVLFYRFNKHLLVVDTVDMSFIENSKARDLLTNGMNHVYWEQLSTEPSRFSKLSKPIHPTTVMRRKLEYIRLLEAYNLTKRKIQLMALIRDKIYKLSGVEVMVKRKVHKNAHITRVN